MTDLTEMWQELARYQPYADKRGFGKAWLRMTTERTEKASCAAAAAAAVAAVYVAAAAWGAATAEGAANSAAREEDVSKWSQLAIENIREAIAQEQT